MTPPPEPRTAAGRLLVDTISEYQGEPDDGQWARRILAIEAEAAGAPLREALERLVAKWDEDGYYVEKEDYDMARAALTATPDPYWGSEEHAAFTAEGATPAPAPHTLADCRDAVEQHIGAAPCEPAPAPLDVARLAAALHSGAEHAEGPMFDCTMQDGTRYCDRKAEWIATADADLTVEQRQRRTPMPSNAEILLAAQLEQAGIPFEREFRFAPEEWCRAHGFVTPVRNLAKAWRADFAIFINSTYSSVHLESPVLIEIDGGGYVAGRHSRGGGMEADAEKQSAAAILGYRVIRCTPRQVENGTALEWIRQALGLAVAA